MSFPSSSIIASFACLLFMAVQLSSCTFSQKTARKLLHEAQAQGGYDAIVVPGVPFEDSTWSYTMKGRVYWSKFLFERGVARNIIYSGSAVYSPYVEAEIMALYARELGIPSQHIFTEPHAEHSTENIYYGHQLAKLLGFEKVALASDVFQTKMLTGFVKRKLGKQVGMLPMVMDSLENMDIRDPEIDPMPAYESDFEALTDREGWWKRFRGTLGRNIDERLYREDSPVVEHQEVDAGK